ncbi:hypothetical protein DPMN_185678 [Dreissena polymorpha]|uniref:Uncharacterized protein n=1 Tax=Dreissena polymorpha TaxID=45954 RepID=A0A9D4DN91_DREPO|nr:hypothetical protein DPMN_185678 [Dreissena polymorpha]
MDERTDALMDGRLNIQNYIQTNRHTSKTDRQKIFKHRHTAPTYKKTRLKQSIHAYKVDARILLKSTTRRTDGRTDRRKNGQIDGRTFKHTDRYKDRPTHIKDRQKNSQPMN